MREIVLTKNKVAFVDNEDYERVNAFRWYFEHGYARRDIRDGKNRERLYMHRFILSLRSSKVVDHKNRNGLDNRKENLRIGNQSLNLANQKKNTKNTSGYKGVCWHKTLKYWVAALKVKGKNNVKYRKTKEEAALAYNEMAIKYFGEFALLNKI